METDNSNRLPLTTRVTQGLSQAVYSILCLLHLELDTLWRREARSSSDSGNLTCKLPLSHRTRHSLESREEEQGREREIERGEARSSSDSGNLLEEATQKVKTRRGRCEEESEDKNDAK